jgi:hypothetical protein
VLAWGHPADVDRVDVAGVGPQPGQVVNAHVQVADSQGQFQRRLAEHREDATVLRPVLDPDDALGKPVRPPAQIRTSSITAYGSYFGCLARKRASGEGRRCGVLAANIFLGYDRRIGFSTYLAPAKLTPIRAFAGNRLVPDGFDGDPDELDEVMCELTEWLDPAQGMAAMQALADHDCHGKMTRLVPGSETC